ncbi:unnamed protein product, partial [Mesorhabditis belari]|uniref:RWD domain-containing protein n=1 Tax=Mesorhabditis belari TaxID=2138241 RepID=A0AAF3F1U1_9BILA
MLFTIFRSIILILVKKAVISKDKKLASLNQKVSDEVQTREERLKKNPAKKISKLACTRELQGELWTSLFHSPIFGKNTVKDEEGGENADPKGPQDPKKQVAVRKRESCIPTVFKDMQDARPAVANEKVAKPKWADPPSDAKTPALSPSPLIRRVRLRRIKIEVISTSLHHQNVKWKTSTRTKHRQFSMDYKEQQEQEIEALEAIYQTDELSVLNNDYPEIELRIDLKSSQEENRGGSVPEFTISLLVELPENYPDVIPKLGLEGVEDLFSEERINQVLSKLNQVAEESVGMVMVFTIFAALQDEIGTLVDDLKQRAETEIEERKKKEEEKSRKKFEGTVVTPDSFLTWKKKFDTERAALKEQQIKDREAQLAGKLTGRQLFLRDATLNLSDVALIEETKGVDIDESLFDAEDLDGLDDFSSDED